MAESHMYTDGVDIKYYRGLATNIYLDRQGKQWSHSQFCQCHLERKLQGK